MKRQAQRYARLLGSFWRHPRTALLSPAAVGVHARALSFCADNMTDGAIPGPIVAAFCGGAVLEGVVEELVEAGIWKRTKTGHQLRDWAQHNITAESWEKSKADVAARVAASRERKRQRNGPSSDDVTRNTSDGHAPETPAPLDEGRRTKDEDEDPSLRSGGDPVPVSDRTLRGLGFPTPMRSEGSLVAMWATAYGDAYRAATGRVWLPVSAVQRIVDGNPPSTHDETAQHLDALAAWIAEVPEADRASAVAAVIAGAWADPWMRERSCPLKPIASSPARWLSAAKPAGGPLPPSPASAFREMSREERQRRLTGGTS